jgi:8-oxo-dGTP pyrophosphatase MutT (NUDIX family)
MTPVRTMLSFDVGDGRFQVRAAAIIRRGDHLLIHRATQDTFWALPGGRIEIFEDGATTLVREIAEEMACTAEAGPLRYLVENFFELGGRQTHELGLFFEAVLTAPFPFSENDICHRCIDGDSELEFRWVAARPEALRRYDFKPAVLIPHLCAPAAGLRHFTQRSA